MPAADMGGQYWPAEHRDGVDVPGAHTAPAGQGEQAPAPASLYWPAAHKTAVALVEPGGHTYPAVQSPVQVDTVEPATPYLPALQLPEHAVVVSPAVAP